MPEAVVAIAQRDRRGYMWLPGIATAVGIPFAAVLYLAPDRNVALLCAVPASLLGAMWLGPTFAMAQGLAKANMRALVSAMASQKRVFRGLQMVSALAELRGRAVGMLHAEAVEVLRGGE